MKKYKIVSGLRRSGTSMLMYALKCAGIPVIGFQFSSTRDDYLKVRAGNPNGYWETKDVTSGTGLVHDFEKMGIVGDLVKIMFEAFPNSNPHLIDKALIIFREPRNVLTSILKWNNIDYLEEFIVMQVLDTIDTIEYLKTFKVDYKFVFYEDIMSNPEQFKDICKFIGGDYKKAMKVVDNKLDRSEPLKENPRNLDKMEEVYNLAKSGDIDKIIEMKDYMLKEGDKLLANKT